MLRPTQPHPVSVGSPASCVSGIDQVPRSPRPRLRTYTSGRLLLSRPASTSVVTTAAALPSPEMRTDPLAISAVASRRTLREPQS